MIERGVYELIKSFAGGRVYAMRAPQNSDAPFVVFQRITAENWRSINAPSGMQQVTFQIDTYANTYYAAKEVAKQIEVALDGYRGFVAYGNDSPQDSVRIGGISFQTDSDAFDQTEEPFLYRVTADYLVTYENGV